MRPRITFHWIRIWGMWQQSEARAKSSWTLRWKVKSCRQTLYTIECTNLVEALTWEGNLSRWWQASTKTTIFKIVSSSSSTTFCLSLFRHFSSSHLNAEWNINIRKTPLYSSTTMGLLLPLLLLLRNPWWLENNVTNLHCFLSLPKSTKQQQWHGSV